MTLTKNYVWHLSLHFVYSLSNAAGTSFHFSRCVSRLCVSSSIVIYRRQAIAVFCSLSLSLLRKIKTFKNLDQVIIPCCYIARVQLRDLRELSLVVSILRKLPGWGIIRFCVCRRRQTKKTTTQSNALQQNNTTIQRTLNPRNIPPVYSYRS